jgi:hypothetical protein
MSFAGYLIAPTPFGCSARAIFFRACKNYITENEQGGFSIMRMHAERRRRWDHGPGLWGCCFGSPWRRPSRREETEELKDYIAELKEALQDAEERLKDLEK